MSKHGVWRKPLNHKLAQFFDTEIYGKSLRLEGYIGWRMLKECQTTILQKKFHWRYVSTDTKSDVQYL